MSKLTILGAGPRGLGVALRAIESGLSVDIIDPSPLNTWTYPNIIPHICMRSPISFDLVSFIDELNQFSLSSYLTGKGIIYTSQKDIEIPNSTPLSREFFFNYLRYIWSYIISNPNVNYIPSIIKGINKDYIILDNDKKYIINGSLVIALGTSNKNISIPNYIKPYIYMDNLLTTKDILIGKENIKGMRVMVVGGGQNAAEHIDYLTPNNQVIWVLNKEPKVDQYPVPTYKEWGPRTALGDYYSRLYKTDKDKAYRYLKEVREWGPSITPVIYKAIKEKKRFITKVNPLDISRYKGIDKVMLCTGIGTSIDELPFLINIERDKSNPDYPYIVNNFKSKEGIYFTGELSRYYDGPRQGSLISIGLTSKIIVEDIING